MHFKVYARTMYCGTLTVTSRGIHIFRNREGNIVDSIHITGYRHLHLRKLS